MSEYSSKSSTESESEMIEKTKMAAYRINKHNSGDIAIRSNNEIREMQRVLKFFDN